MKTCRRLGLMFGLLLLLTSCGGGGGDGGSAVGGGGGNTCVFDSSNWDSGCTWS